MLLLAVPVELFLSGGTNRSAARGIKIAVMSVMVVIAFAWASTSIFSQRFRDISQGNDPSFFFRVTGPALIAIDVMHRHPWAGSGLTAENYIADEIMNVYMRSGIFYSGWQFEKISDSITNYFWLHWIYLGVIWGVVVVVALNFWLKVLGVSNTVFCWMVWAILGQASGAYVSPKTWTVFLLAAAAAVVRRQQPAQAGAVQAAPRAYGSTVLASGRLLRS
jgi:hypothetical protein